MPIPFLSKTAIVDIVSAGWTMATFGETHMGQPEAVFEAPGRALQLTIGQNPATGEMWANVWSSYFEHGTRTKYPVEPIVHADYAAGRVTADAIRTELQFLKAHGIALKSACLHYMTTGNRTSSRKTAYFGIGGQS